jgi:class 3 adenylate cyclase
MACVSCSQPLSERARFCSFCGHEVHSSTAEERRVVSVVFADIVGYTALSEHLDPERVKRLIDGAFVLLIDEIERFGGRVDKVLGDGILALFGAPVAHEDDPDRAVRASIEMHRTLTHFVEAQSDLAPLIQLRIGVNTGEVVVGTVSGTDVYTAMGDVVNVASRLQSMAPAGGIYVGTSCAAGNKPKRFGG